MKTFLKFIAVFIITVLLFSCQSQSDIYGKWEVSDIVAKDTTKNMGYALVVLSMAISDFNYLEFTDQNEMKYYNSADSMISEGRYLLSEDGGELLMKGWDDETADLNVISHTEIVLETEDAILKLKRRN